MCPRGMGAIPGPAQGYPAAIQHLLGSSRLCWHRNTLQGARSTALGVELPSGMTLCLALSSAFSPFAAKAVELSFACPCSHRENLKILMFFPKQTQLKKILFCFFLPPLPSIQYLHAIFDVFCAFNCMHKGRRSPGSWKWHLE